MVQQAAIVALRRPLMPPPTEESDEHCRDWSSGFKHTAAQFDGWNKRRETLLRAQNDCLKSIAIDIRLLGVDIGLKAAAEELNFDYVLAYVPRTLRACKWRR